MAFSKYKKSRKAYDYKRKSAYYKAKYVGAKYRGMSNRVAASSTGAQMSSSVVYTSPRGFSGPSEEMKSNDTHAVAVLNAGVGNIYLLNGILQGDEVNNREGRQICVKSIALRALFTGEDGSTDQNAVRCLIVLDRSSNGGTPLYRDVIDWIDSGSTDVGGPTAFMNLNNRQRFKILFDSFFPFPGGGNGASQFPSVINKYITTQIITTYNGTGITAASLSTNSLWLMFMDTKAVATTVGARVNFTCRVRYTDS